MTPSCDAEMTRRRAERDAAHPLLVPFKNAETDATAEIPDAQLAIQAARDGHRAIPGHRQAGHRAGMADQRPGLLQAEQLPTQQATVLSRGDQAPAVRMNARAVTPP